MTGEKETMMNTSTKAILGIAAVSALAIAAANGVFAAPGWGYGPGMMGPGMMGGSGYGYGYGRMGGPGMGPGVMMSSDPMGATQEQLTQLKTELAITPAQQKAWEAYADAVTGRTALMLSHRATMFGGGPIGPDQRATFHQQGFGQMQRVITATNDLNKVLTPAQREKAGGQLGTYGPMWTR
jgi:hypothetical protein